MRNAAAQQKPSPTPANPSKPSKPSPWLTAKAAAVNELDHLAVHLLGQRRQQLQARKGVDAVLVLVQNAPQLLFKLLRPTHEPPHPSVPVLLALRLQLLLGNCLAGAAAGMVLPDRCHVPLDALKDGVAEVAHKVT